MPDAADLLMSARTALQRGRLDEAEALLESALRNDPGNVPALLLSGGIASRTGNAGKAMLRFKEALRLEPTSFEASSSLGALALAQGDPQTAVESFRKAISLAPPSPHVLTQIGNSFLEAARPSEASEFLSKALALDPNSPATHSLLAAALQQLGEFDAARKHMLQSLELNPSQGSTYYALVSSKRLTASDEPLVRKMEALLAAGNLQQEDERGIQFALGKAFDDLRDYEKAIAHFDRANEIELEVRARSGRPFDRQMFDRIRAQAVHTYDKSFFDKGRGIGSNSELPILIVGMIRSGTTLVEQILSSHPQVGAGGELSYWRTSGNFLDKSGKRMDPVASKALADGYIRLLGNLAPGKARVTDKMPHNFLSLGPIHLLFPGAKIIHCRRNPLDNALSIYMTHFGRVSPPYGNRREDIIYFFNLYRQLMDHWRALLPNGSMLEVDYEEIVADREKMARRMISFCGLPWDDACLSHEKNTRMVNTPSLWQARQPVYSSSVEKWRHYEPWLGALSSLR